MLALLTNLHTIFAQVRVSGTVTDADCVALPVFHRTGSDNGRNDAEINGYYL
jgi:hypothetical protein